MTDPVSLAFLFQIVRRHLDEPTGSSRLDAADALDKIARRQHDEHHLGGGQRCPTSYVDPGCTALRLACRGLT